MSIKATTWAWSQPDLLPSAKLVLVALAEHANEAGHCWPSIERMCAMTCLSRTTIWRTLQILTGVGLVQQVPKGRGYAFNLTLDMLHGELCDKPKATQVMFHPEPDMLQPETDMFHGETPMFQDETLTVMNPNEPSKKERAEPKQRLLADWQPDTKLMAWAQERAPHVDTTLETEKFLDHFVHIKPDRRSCEGWRASWRTWMLRARRDYTPAAARFLTRSERTSQRNATIVGDALAHRTSPDDGVRDIPGTPFRLIDGSKA